MEIKDKIEKLIKETLKKFDYVGDNFSVEHPKIIDHGDYSTNAIIVAGKMKEISEILDFLNKNKPVEVQKIEVKNGFINFYLSKEFFADSIKEILEKKENFGKNDSLKNKKIMVEYTQPNPFKPFHIGHLMSNAIGETISRLIEFSGAKIVRANYQGDVGPHVAKAIYGLLKKGCPDESNSISEKAHYIGQCYAEGNNFYEENGEAKKEIDEINKKIYDKSDSEINQIYDWGRKVTLEAFEEIYSVLGTKFDKYFFESVMAPLGEKIVRKNIGKVFEKSDGAVVFHAEKYDPKLHTRVFINSQNLPTYETKEVGLTSEKFKKGFFSKKLDLSIVTTAVEQAEYMKVVQKAISLIHPDLENRMKHITHGMMRFASGKMSSRLGNVITGESLIQDSQTEILEKIKDRDFSEKQKKEIAQNVGVAALKYSILKQAIGADIIYDFEKSISFEGDSGPYLQYSYARAKSILEKAKEIGITSNPLPTLPLIKGEGEGRGLDSNEISEVEHLLYRFPEVVLRSTKEFSPHYIANYLIELARAFNTFYGNTKIVDKEDSTSAYKLALTEAFSIVMKNGLFLLGIRSPEKM